MKAHSQKFIQRRKFYMMMPMLVLPFMTMFFWSLGGGKGLAVAKTQESIGLNVKLPGAKFNEEDDNAWDKLSLYQKARRDSVKANQAKRSDPYFRLATLKVSQDTSKRDSLRRAGGINASLGDRTVPLDATEAKVYKKLSELQKEIDKPTTKANGRSTPKPQTSQAPNEGLQSDVDRLEGLMQMMQNDPAQDKEMQEINGVLSQILDIQHPERVKERMEKLDKENSNTLVARPNTAKDQITTLGNNGAAQTLPGMFAQNGFFGLEESVLPALEANAIRAEIYGNQNLVSGSVIKMELQQDINISGVRIPKSHYVYGLCALNGERLTIKVSSIQYDNSVYPVSLTVYDVDGLEGIHVPGAIARDAAKKSSNQAIQDIQLSSLDPSIEVQAASAGIEAAKGLLSKKTRLIQVTVKAGYKVFLKDKNNQDTDSK